MNTDIKRIPVRRQQFLKQTTAIVAGTTLASSASCLELFDLGGGSAVSRGGGPMFQDVHREDADVVVESEAALESEVNRGDGQVIWIPSDAQIDITGRNSPAMDDTVLTLEEGGRLTGITSHGPH